MVIHREILILFCITLLGAPVSSQNFIDLGNDAAGDCMCSCMDLKALSYAYDKGQDSVWFKIETHSARTANYGYYIVVDMDDTTSNGSSRTGSSATTPCPGVSSYDINHDRMIVAWPGDGFIEAFDGGGENILHHNVSRQPADDYTIVIGVKLSDVDANADGQFDLIAGAGEANNYKVFDVYPDNGSIPAGIVPQMVKENKVHVYPNPFSEHTTLMFAKNGPIKDYSLIIYNSIGKEVFSYERLKTNQVRIERKELSQGIYFYKLRKESGIVAEGTLIIE